jgi:hypothetical protein
MVQSTKPDPSPDRPQAETSDAVNIAAPSSPTLELLTSTEGNGDSNGEATGDVKQETDSPRAMGQATYISPTGRPWDMIVLDQILESLNDNHGKCGLEPELHEYFTCVMSTAGADKNSVSQETVDQAFTKVKHLILGSSPSNKPKRERKISNGKRLSKRKLKKYQYARTQNLFKEGPRTLAHYIREGIPWIDNQAIDPSPCDIRSLYEDLWGVSPR